MVTLGESASHEKNVSFVAVRFSQTANRNTSLCLSPSAPLALGISHAFLVCTEYTYVWCIYTCIFIESLGLGRFFFSPTNRIICNLLKSDLKRCTMSQCITMSKGSVFISVSDQLRSCRGSKFNQQWWIYFRTVERAKSKRCCR